MDATLTTLVGGGVVSALMATAAVGAELRRQSRGRRDGAVKAEDGFEFSQGCWRVGDGGEGFTHIWYVSDRTGELEPVNMDLEHSDLLTLRTAITAALGDGALVVDKARLRDALVNAWNAGTDYHGTGYGEDTETIDAILARLTAPEVKG